eukprot:12914271-Prorocentrum_lima.AAC.1
MVAEFVDELVLSVLWGGTHRSSFLLPGSSAASASASDSVADIGGGAAGHDGEDRIDLGVDPS